MSRPSVLIVDADESVREAMERCIERTGCHVVTSNATASDIASALKAKPAVILLCNQDDETSKLLREQLNGATGPVIVHAPQLEPECVDGKVEAADLQLSEFADGISALANSTNESYLLSSVVTREGLRLDKRSYEAFIDDRELKLTLTEFKILWQLARRAGTVFSRQELCDECRDSRISHACRAIDVHIRSLRVKLGNRAKLIETVRGAGYRFSTKSSDGTISLSLPDNSSESNPLESSVNGSDCAFAVTEIE